MNPVACLYHGEALGRYGFPFGHPLGVDRQGAILREALSTRHLAPRRARITQEVA